MTWFERLFRERRVKEIINPSVTTPSKRIAQSSQNCSNSRAVDVSNILKNQQEQLALNEGGRVHSFIIANFSAKTADVCGRLEVNGGTCGSYREMQRQRP